MAKFEGNIGGVNPPNPVFLDRVPTARKTTADTSGSTLAGAVVKAGFQAIDLKIGVDKRTILDAEREIADSLFSANPSDPASEAQDTEFTGRIGEDSEAAVPRFTEGSKIPVSVTTAFRRFERQRAGVGQGRLRESFFRDKMDKDLKALRHRFPHLRNFIDGEARRITGLPSANSLFLSRQADARAAATLQDKQVVRRRRLIADAVGTGEITVEQASTMADDRLSNVTAEVVGKRAREAEYLKTVARNEKQRDELAIFTDSESTKDYTANTKIAGIDAIVESTRDIFRRAGRKNEVPFEEIEQIGKDARGAIETIVDRQEIFMTAVIVGDPQGRSRADIMREADPGFVLADYLKEQSQFEIGMLDALISGKENIFNANETARKLRQSSLATKMKNEVKGFSEFLVKWEALGKNADPIMRSDQFASLKRDRGLGKNIEEFFVTERERANNLVLRGQHTLQDGVGSGNGSTTPAVTQTELDSTIRRDNSSITGQNLTRKTMTDTVIQILLDPAMDKDLRKKQARFLFNPVDRGSYLARVQSSEQQGLYNQRYNPSVAAAIKELGDPGITNEFFLAGMADLASLHSTNASRVLNADNPLVSLTVDEETGLIKTTLTPSELDPLAAGTGAFGDNAVLNKQAGEIVVAADGFNQMALQFANTMSTLRGDSSDDAIKATIGTFMQSVVGIPEFQSASQTTHVKLVKAAVRNTPISPPLAGVSDDPGLGRSDFRIGIPDPEIDLSAGTPEDDGGQTATVPAPEVRRLAPITLEEQISDLTDFPTVANFGSGSAETAAVKTAVSTISRGTVLKVIDTQFETIDSPITPQTIKILTQIESNFRSDAKAKTSSASGTMQFIEKTWLRILKQEADALGIGPLAALITIDAKGNPQVEDAEMKKRLLNLRFNPAFSTKVGVKLAEQNRAILLPVLGREPGVDELYIAHFAGAGAAKKIFTEAAKDPKAPVTKALGAAAMKANRALLTSRGKAISFISFFNRIRKQKIERAEKAIATLETKAAFDDNL